MHVIVGDTRASTIVEFIKREGWGRMYVERSIRLYEGEKWGFDNGAYIDWKNEDEFDGDRFLRRLDIAYAYPIPCLAVVPDIVGGGANSLEFSEGWIERLPKEWPWYLAVQDGMEGDVVEQVLGRYSGIFLGGTNAFKATAAFWCEMAHRHGISFHYARAGTTRKVIHAKSIGADSLDSAFPLWNKDRLAWFAEIVNEGHPQVDLFV